MIQGVNFRAACRGMALQHGVHGRVRNVPDGSVEAAFEGLAGDVGHLLNWKRRGLQLTVVALPPIPRVLVNLGDRAQCAC